MPAHGLPPGHQHRGPARHRASAPAALRVRLRGRRRRGRAHARAQPRCLRTPASSGRGRWWTSASATSSARLLGAPSAMPAVVGPTGLNGLSWRDGDLELARAAAAAGLPFAMSTVSMSLVEDVAREAPGRLWLQAYVFSERRITEAIMQRALEAGFECVVLTSDFPVAGKRERDLRTGLLPQQEFTLRDEARHADAPALARDRRDTPPALRQRRARARPRAQRQCLRRARHVRSLVLLGRREAFPRPLAAQAAAEGRAARGRCRARAGGRLRRHRAVEPRRPPARRRGERPRRAARGRARGRRPRFASWWTAACGAAPTSRRPWRSAPRACCSGARPFTASRPADATGVAHALGILADEFDRTLALTGCPDVASLTPDLVAQRMNVPPRGHPELRAARRAHHGGAEARARRAAAALRHSVRARAARPRPRVRAHRAARARDRLRQRRHARRARGARRPIGTSSARRCTRRASAIACSRSNRAGSRTSASSRTTRSRCSRNSWARPRSTKSCSISRIPGRRSATTSAGSSSRRSRRSSRTG